MKKSFKFISGIIMISALTNASITNFTQSKIQAHASSSNSNSNESKNGEFNRSSSDKIKSSSNDSSKFNSPTDTVNSPTNTSDTLLEDDDTLLEDDDTLLEDDDTLLEDDDTLLEDDDTLLEDDSESDLLDDKTDNSSTNSGSTSDDYSDLLSELMTNKDLDISELKELTLPITYTDEFVQELFTSIPSLTPLRPISTMQNSPKSYVDIKNSSLHNTIDYLSTAPSDIPLYSTQNKSGMLLAASQELLNEIELSFEEESPLAVASLIPTLLVLQDTLNILNTEYSNTIQHNSSNQQVLNLLLRDLDTKSQELFNSINEFNELLPELLLMLDDLLGSTSTDDKDTSTDDKDTLTDDEDTLTDDEDTLTDDEDTLTDDEDTLTDDEDTTTDDEDTTTDDEDTTTDDKDTTTDDKDTTTDDEDTTTDDEDTSTDEEKGPYDDIDPKTITLYFGESGQEIIYDKLEKKYFEYNSENKLVEYTGSVNKMSLDEYLKIELFFDEEGYELIYDQGTNSYLTYNSETEEFEVYTGKISKMTMKEFLKLYGEDLVD